MCIDGWAFICIYMHHGYRGINSKVECIVCYELKGSLAVIGMGAHKEDCELENI